MMNDLHDILASFKPISLSEMDTVELQDRTDTKFIFNRNRLTKLLELASHKYQILEIKGGRTFSYHTTYLDTKKFDFYKHHIHSRPNRYKVRYRVYEATGDSFLETKLKTNKKRTIKHRIKNHLLDDGLDTSAIAFLKMHIKDVAHEVEPVLINRFSRITLVGIETNERITIDYNLSFHLDKLNSINLPYLAIAELKREGLTNKSPFLTMLKMMEIRQSSFSKYCIGSAMLRKDSKSNTLKPLFLRLNKIENDKLVAFAN